MSADSSRPGSGFKSGIGDWSGTAEVFDGTGQFLGNAADRRIVQRQVEANTVRIDLSFVGPFKFAGHYSIQDQGTHRLYQGPANIGYAESLSDGLIDAQGYWPAIGLSQRFFLYVLPDGNHQLSLALMSRGEQLIYTVVGEYEKIAGDSSGVPPGFVSGTSFDFQADPNAGRSEAMLLRSGSWIGELTTLNETLEPIGQTAYKESVQSVDDMVQVSYISEPFDKVRREVQFRKRGSLLWSGDGAVVGSASLSGGRGLSGQLHHREQALRVWRREVASHDGQSKVLLLTWYRGGTRIGVQFGVTQFEARA